MVGIFGIAYMRTRTPDKIISAFKSRGLWPFNYNIFGRKCFTVAEITEETLPVDGTLELIVEEVVQANTHTSARTSARTVDDQAAHVVC